jgi:hypothetical protein
MGCCLALSFRTLAPTHHAVLACRVPVSEGVFSAALRKFTRKLRRRSGGEFLVVNEWRGGRRHVHCLIRVPGALRSRDVGAWWSSSCPVPARHSCTPVRNPVGLGRYVFKDVKDQSQVEAPPGEFTGRLFSYSRAFFAAPIRDLWRAQLREWEELRRTSAIDAHDAEEQEKR